MGGALRASSFFLVVPSAFILASGNQLGAQSTARLPACGAADPRQDPCQLPFDRAPMLRERAAVPDHPGERRTAQLWIYVDTAGLVQNAQVQRGAGVDWDMAAIQLVRHFTFDAATRGGRPTPAWVLFALAVVPKPQTCDDFEMAVPISAGAAVFVDSLAYVQRELGVAYRYRIIDDSPADVFIYPRGERGTPEYEVVKTLEAMQGSLVKPSADSMRLRTRGRQRVRTEYRGSKHDFVGYRANFRVWIQGHEVESYVGAFPVGQSYVKIRVTHPPTRRARDLVDEFTRQMLSNQHWRTLGCPR